MEKPHLTLAESTARFVDQTDWFALGDKLDIVSLKILEKIYLPEVKTLAFAELIGNMSRMNVSKSTIRNRLLELEKIGLVSLIKSKPMVIWSVKGIEVPVRNLVKYGYARYGLVTRWEK